MKLDNLSRNMSFILNPLRKRTTIYLLLAIFIVLVYWMNQSNQKSRFAVEFRFAQTTERLSQIDQRFVGAIFMQRYNQYTNEQPQPFEINAYFLRDVLTVRIVGKNLEEILNFSDQFNQEILNMLQSITLELYHKNNIVIDRFRTSYGTILNNNIERLEDFPFLNLDELTYNRLRGLIRILNNRILNFEETLVSTEIHANYVESWSMSTIQLRIIDYRPIRFMILGLIIFVFLLIFGIINNHIDSFEEEEVK